MLLKVFNAYIEDKLEEKLEESYEVGFELSFDSSIRGLSFELYGWSDNFDNFYK